MVRRSRDLDDSVCKSQQLGGNKSANRRPAGMLSTATPPGTSRLRHSSMCCLVSQMLCISIEADTTISYIVSCCSLPNWHSQVFGICAIAGNSWSAGECIPIHTRDVESGRAALPLEMTALFTIAVIDSKPSTMSLGASLVCSSCSSSSLSLPKHSQTDDSLVQASTAAWSSELFWGTNAALTPTKTRYAVVVSLNLYCVNGCARQDAHKRIFSIAFGMHNTYPCNNTLIK